MKVALIWIGKTSEAWIHTGINEYIGRLKHYLNFELKEISGLKQSRNLTEIMIKSKEGELIEAHLQPGDFLVLLDENGKTYTSVELAQFIDKQSVNATKRVVFVIGGAYGFSDAMYEKCNHKLSLSRMTFSHQMVRVIFLEQLYRAMTILKGEPYHHI